MARRRGRKESGLLELVLKSDWPVAAVAAVLVAVVGFWLMPLWFGRHPMLAQLPGALRPLVWLLFGFCSIAAIAKFLLAKRADSKRRMHEYIAREETDRFVRQAVSRAEQATVTARQKRRVRTAHHSQELPHREGPACAVRTLPAESDRESHDDLPRERERSFEQRAEADARRAEQKPAAWSLALIQRIEWKRFEDLCAAFYREKGIRCTTTSLGPDGGIDIRLMQDEADGQATTAIVQCKAWGERLVGVKPVRELLGVMTHEKIAKAFFMTSGGFTEEARTVAEANRITLLDGKLFLAMIERLPEASQQRLLTFATEGDYATPSCPGCGVKMLAREGAKGRFWGCPAYPKCKHILQIRAVSRPSQGQAPMVFGRV
jgi:restriction system protein